MSDVGPDHTEQSEATDWPDPLPDPEVEPSHGDDTPGDDPDAG